MSIIYRAISSVGLIWLTCCSAEEQSILLTDVTKALARTSTKRIRFADECKTADHQAPWVFHDDFYKMTPKNPWITYHEMNESSLPEVHVLENLIPKPVVFEMPSLILEMRWKLLKDLNITYKSCENYRDCTQEQVFDFLLSYKKSFEDRNVAIFENVWVDMWGLIVDRVNCQTVRNGACTPAPYPFQHNKVHGPDYPLCISLATSWKGTWHFPMENIAALAHIDQEILNQAVFHLPLKTAYITMWLATLGVPDSRMVTDTVACKVLVIPQMRCGEPYYSQIEWMRRAYLPQETALQQAAIAPLPATAAPAAAATSASAAEGNSDTNTKITTGESPEAAATAPAPAANAVPVATDATTAGADTSQTAVAAVSSDAAAPLSILVIERHKTRSITNVHTVHNVIQSFAQTNKMKLLMHSDINLPSLLDQMRNFAQADIIVAPHGAGLMFTTFSPYTSCIVEFAHPMNPFCYAHIAYIRNMSYIMVDMRDNTINIAELQKSMGRCLEAVKTSKLHAHERSRYTLPIVHSSDAGSISGSNSGSGSESIDGVTDGSSKDKPILSTVAEGITNIIKSDSVVKSVLTTLSNFVP